MRWLRTGAEEFRKSAQARTKSVIRQTGVDQRPISQNLKTAAGALIEFGRGAYAELLHSQAEASEYVLQDERFDVLSGSSIKSISYDRVKRVEIHADRAIFTLDKGHFVIKPFAHIVAGRTKVPIGWVRNGTEVPFELLVEELAARCGLDVEEES